MTSVAQAVPPPGIVGVHDPHPNAFGALGDAFLVDSNSLPKDVEDGMPVASGSLQAVIDA